MDEEQQPTCNGICDRQSMSNMCTKIDSIVTEPFNYLAGSNGKEIRAKLILAFNSWLHVPEKPLLVISEVIRMLHNASLIIDDIEDGSVLRRGNPAVHCVFGVPTAINSANFIYFRALEKLTELKHPDAVTIFTDQMLELHRGQGLDIYWRSSFRCPTESEFCDMAVRKTGGLFGLAVRLMQLFSESKEDFKPLLDALGLWFQIRDDYANLVDTSYHNAKTFAEDLTEGKFSYPIVWSIQAHPSDTQVMNILYQKTSNPVLKRYCVQHMVKLGALDHTSRVLVEIEDKCRKMIEKHGTNSGLIEFLDKLGQTYRAEDRSPRVHDPSDFASDQVTAPPPSASALAVNTQFTRPLLGKLTLVPSVLDPSLSNGSL